MTPRQALKTGRFQKKFESRPDRNKPEPCAYKSAGLFGFKAQESTLKAKKPKKAMVSEAGQGFTILQGHPLGPF